MICDDHEIVREALRAQIEAEQDFRVVAEVGDREAMLRAVRATGPDLVILDIELPDSNGIALMSELLKEQPDLRIMVFSAHEQPDLIRLVADSGARGFVGKSESTKAIVPAARTVLEGETRFPFEPGDRTDANGNGNELLRLRSLTPRERQILNLLADGMRATGVSEQIGIHPATVYTHVRNAIHKLGVKTRTQAVAIATRYHFLQDLPENDGRD
jgi:DNA-binding NarL/FixJ family response regulator